MRRLTLIAAALVAFAAPTLAQDDLRGTVKKIQISWAKVETKSFTINYESVIPKETVDKIGGELEDILKQYIAIFKTKPDGKLIVKFLDSPNTYKQEGGDQSHPGMYIETGTEKFLLIQQMPFYQLVPIVYHEAFHQYLSVYLGDVRAPTWFNEGMAMYYEGMQRDDRTGKLDPKLINKRKLRMVKDAIRTRQHIPIEKLVDSTYAQFHEKETEGLHYASSFALIYFFMQGKGGKVMLAYGKELKKAGDTEAALEKLFGKKRKKLAKYEKAFKRSMLALPEEE